MTAIDVRHGFVSCVILTEIERMRPTSPSPLPAAVAHFEALFGPVDSWQRLAPESEQAVLWLGVRRGTPLGVIKRYQSAAGAGREHFAYTEWATQISAWTAPFYGRVEADPRALTLGYVTGETATFDATPAVFENIGRFARALHQLPYVDEDPLPLQQAVGRRLAALEDTEPGVARVVEVVERLIERAHFGGRVPCHRDLAPWNWRVDGEDVRVLDFGQSRADTWLMDVVKLAPQWSSVQEEAFFSGYGRHLSESESWALIALVGLHGLGGVQWGRRHDQQRPVMEGEAALRWFWEALRRHPLG